MQTGIVAVYTHTLAEQAANRMYKKVVLFFLEQTDFSGSSTFDVEFNPFDCMADYGLFQNLHKEVTACECQ